MKKNFLKIVVFLLTICIFAGCGAKNTQNISDEKLDIVALNFPAYDFARQVCGDSASIKMLVPPGSEVHTFDPTPKDRIDIENCDIFIYTGGESDVWAEKMLASSENSERICIKMTDAADLEYEDSDAIIQADGEDDGEAEYDEHVWTSPSNAIKIVNVIAEAAMTADSENADKYRDNAQKYTNELAALRDEISDVVDNADRKTLVFADRFAARYFTEEFGLSYFAAFPGCSAQTQASAKTVAALIDKVRDEKIPVVLYIEFSDQKLADSVCEATGAKKLLFHSAHNVTKDEFESGITYIKIMKQNIETLREALKNGSDKM